MAGHVSLREAYARSALVAHASSSRRPVEWIARAHATCSAEPSSASTRCEHRKAAKGEGNDLARGGDRRSSAVDLVEDDPLDLLAVEMRAFLGGSMTQVDTAAGR